MQCQGLTKSFGGICALRDLILNFEAGKVTAIIGPNGAGKSTFLNVISGFVAPDKGEIIYRKQKIEGLSPYRIARLGIGRLFQEARIFGELTVMDNVLVSFPHQLGENPIWSLVRWRKVREEERARAADARVCLETVGLSRLCHRRAEELSYGQQKLLAFARLLAHGVDVFLLDEPTAGVHPEGIKLILELIRKWANDGKTVVLIEHNMNVVAEVSDRVDFMDKGKVVASGLPREVLEDQSIRASYLGL